MSASDGAFETAEPAADMKPNGMSASRALIDARRTRPDSELSLAWLGRPGEDSLAVFKGGKVGERGDAEGGWTSTLSGVFGDMMVELGGFGRLQRTGAQSIA